MYIETSNKRYGDTARLISKRRDATQQTCLSFWYHMYGAHINTLRVLVSNGGQNFAVWSKTGQSVNSWLQGQVNIQSYHQYQVSLLKIMMRIK